MSQIDSGKTGYKSKINLGCIRKNGIHELEDIVLGGFQPQLVNIDEFLPVVSVLVATSQQTLSTCLVYEEAVTTPPSTLLATP